MYESLIAHAEDPRSVGGAAHLVPAARSGRKNPDRRARNHRAPAQPRRRARMCATRWSMPATSRCAARRSALWRCSAMPAITRPVSALLERQRRQLCAPRRRRVWAASEESGRSRRARTRVQRRAQDEPAAGGRFRAGCAGEPGHQRIQPAALSGKYAERAVVSRRRDCVPDGTGARCEGPAGDLSDADRARPRTKRSS